jgi:hypothetical protein
MNRRLFDWQWAVSTLAVISVSAFQLSELRGPEEGSAGLVDQRGFEPLTS